MMKTARVAMQKVASEVHVSGKRSVCFAHRPSRSQCPSRIVGALCQQSLSRRHNLTNKITSNGKTLQMDQHRSFAAATSDKRNESTTENAREKAKGAAEATRDTAKQTADAAVKKAEGTADTTKQTAEAAKEKSKEKLGETQERSRETAEEAKEKTKEMANAAKERAEQAKEAAKEKTGETASTLKERAEQAKERVEQAKEAAKEKTGETASTMKETAEWAKERAEEAKEATKEKLSETASTAKQKAEQAKEAAKEKTNETASRMQETAERAKERAEQAKEAAKEKLSGTASTAKNTVERAKGAASETANEAMNRMKSTAHGTAQATAETTGQASTPQGASGAYGALTAMHGALGSAHVLSPTLASDFIFASAAQPFDLMQYPLHRLLGTGHLAAAWSMWILKGAAEKRKLHLPEFQRLNLGLTIFAAATLGMNMLHWDLLRPSAALTAATIAGITASVPALFYSRTSGHGLRVRPIFEGLTHDLGNLMQIRGMKSEVYSALTVAILGAGSAYMAMPYESLTNVFTYAKGPDCIMLWRSIGAALLMLPTWTYNLKEAADAGALHKPQFLDLNTGLAMTGLAHLVVLGPWWLHGYSGPLMPYILGTWAAAFAVGTWGVFGNKPTPV